jgi:hypothetical protein
MGIALLVPGRSEAQQMFAYPTQGQGPQQQQRDRADCHIWAVQQSGFDPANPQVAAAGPPSYYESPQGGLLRGGARGAAVGAMGGAIAGNAGKGAAIGAVTGGLIGGTTRNEGQLIFQGAENGRGWSASLSQETGKIAIAVAGDEVVFSFFGAGIPRP